MSEYEKAMILLSMQQAEYLHIIAMDRNPAKARLAAERTINMLSSQCPEVAAFLKTCAEKHV